MGNCTSQINKYKYSNNRSYLLRVSFLTIISSFSLLSMHTPFSFWLKPEMCATQWLLSYAACRRMYIPLTKTEKNQGFSEYVYGSGFLWVFSTYLLIQHLRRIWIHYVGGATLKLEVIFPDLASLLLRLQVCSAKLGPCSLCWLNK